MSDQKQWMNSDGSRINALGRRTVTLMTATLAAILAFMRLQAAAEPGRIGTVQEVRGTVTVTRGAQGPQALAPNNAVLVDDRIMTGSDSMVQVRFTDAQMRLAEQSNVAVSKREGVLVLNLNTGRLRYQLPRTGRDEPQAVISPNLAAQAEGVLLVGVASWMKDVITSVCIAEGNGSVAILGGPKVELPARMCVSGTGDVLDTPRPMSPAPMLNILSLHLPMPRPRARTESRRE